MLDIPAEFLRYQGKMKKELFIDGVPELNSTPPARTK